MAWSGNGCGIAYRLKWELQPTIFVNDPEPNNTASVAIPLLPDVPQEGFLGDPDWYKLFKPYSGDLQLTVRGAFHGYEHREHGGAGLQQRATADLQWQCNARPEQRAEHDVDHCARFDPRLVLCAGLQQQPSIVPRTN
jgi:hypothetical protein